MFFNHPITATAQVRVLRRHSYCVTDHHRGALLIYLNERLFTCVGNQRTVGRKQKDGEINTVGTLSKCWLDLGQGLIGLLSDSYSIRDIACLIVTKTLEKTAV